MKIEVKQDKNVVLFKDVEAGEVFEYNSYYHIKVSVTFKSEGVTYNAIDLDEGGPMCFDDDDEVFIPSAKLIIE